VEAVWVQEQRDKDQAIAELVDDLDKASAEKDAAAAGHAEEFTRLEAQRGALERQLSFSSATRPRAKASARLRPYR
jgi:hypothetical protein